jgi:magnesium-transporting ATPase (P-type)
MPTILASGRASLEAATSASAFLICGWLSFAFYVLFGICSVSTTLAYVPIMGAVIFLQIILPLVGLPITMSDPDKNSMQRVPPKNDPAITFGRREGKGIHTVALLKALPPAIFPQLLYLIAFGELMIRFEPSLLSSACSPGLQPGDWTSVIRCEGLHDYCGAARDSAAALALAELIICTVVASAAFVHRTLPLYEEPPWQRNSVWCLAVVAGILITAAYLGSTLEQGSLSVLPWYFFVLAGIMPFLCLAWDEWLKRTERALLDRAEKLRRLLFETRYVSLIWDRWRELF